MFGKYQKNALAPITKLQLELSEKYITPHVVAFEQAFYDLRRVMDQIWLTGDSNSLPAEKKAFMLEQVLIHKRKIGRFAKVYPLGKCYNITKIAFSYINKFELNDERSPFFPLGEFVKQGGVFKIIWGEVRHEVFQTATQMGNWYFDAANDTVVITKPKVLRFTFDSAQNEFHQVDSVQQYIDIKKKYHECEIYLNTMIPSVSQLFPLLVVKGDKVLIDDSRHVADIMQFTNYTFLVNNTLPLLPADVRTQNRAKLLDNNHVAAIALWLGEAIKDIDMSNANEAYRVVKHINFILKFN
jgi:hypothetical protein